MMANPELSDYVPDAPLSSADRQTLFDQLMTSVGQQMYDRAQRLLTDEREERKAQDKYRDDRIDEIATHLSDIASALNNAVAAITGVDTTLDAGFSNLTDLLERRDKRGI